MILLIISAALTVFLFVATIMLFMGGENVIDARLMEVAAPEAPHQISLEHEQSDLGRLAASATGFLQPIRNLITGDDSEMQYQLALAGFRRPEHVEIYTACKMLMPVLAIIVATFFGNLVIGVMVGAVAGYFGPDMVLSYLITRRQKSIRHALPDALDLLVICMEAGLGIDQALLRVGEEIKLTSPALAEEIQIINREQRAGKPRLEAWRSMAERVDVDYVRQFVTMLMQTERFGTPIAQSLGQFADSLRERRTQAAEEIAARTGVKLLFPLVLFIFPSIFVVSLGPTILNIQKVLANLFK
jgi:tight adherence protein C